MKFETVNDNEIKITNRDGTETVVNTKGAKAEDVSALLEDYYRAGFVEGVNVMAEAAKNAGVPVGGRK